MTRIQTESLLNNNTELLPQSWRKFIDDQENGPKILFVGWLVRCNTISVEWEGDVQWVVFAEKATRPHEFAVLLPTEYVTYIIIIIMKVILKSITQ